MPQPDDLTPMEAEQIEAAAAMNGNGEPAPDPGRHFDPHAAGPEFGCPECEEWHKLLIDEARMLGMIGLGLTAAVLALGLVLYLRSRA